MHDKVLWHIFGPGEGTGTFYAMPNHFCVNKICQNSRKTECHVYTM